MATCKQCREFEKCKDDAFINGAKFDPNESAKYCTGFEPITNADRIRAMSDEELAAYWSYHYDDFCPNLPECGEMLNQDQEIPAEKCIGCALRWLQEVEP